MKHVILLLTFLLSAGATAQSSPCYWSGQLVKCFPTTGIYLDNGRVLQLGTDNTTNYVQLQAPSGMGSNWTMILPAAASGQIGYALIDTDGSGTMGWAAGGVSQATLNSALEVQAPAKPADIACATNVTPSGSPTCDGQSTSGDFSALLLNESSPANNGYWVVNNFGAWTRDVQVGDTANLPGKIFCVDELGGGTNYSNTCWLGTYNGGNFSFLQLPETSLSTVMAASSALVTNASSAIATSSTTATELGYVHGVTSAIQTQLNAKLALAGGTMTGALVLSGDATTSLNPITKQQFDAAVLGLDAKQPVAVATTANITLLGEQTIDGVTTSSSRVLVKNQSTASQNGIYVSSTIAWLRATDMNTWSEVAGALVPVDAGGTANGGTLWLSTSAASGTIGVTDVTFSQIQPGGNYITALTGDVTASGPGSAAATIANLAVTNAKIANTTIDLTAKVTGTLPLANGGTAVTSVTTAPTATAFAGWDGSSNLSANNFIPGYTTTVTAGTQTTLTVASTRLQFFTGTTTHTAKLPVTSTLVLGQQFEIVNNSTGIVTIQSSGGGTVVQLAGSSAAVVTCILTSGTTSASWNYEYAPQSAGTVSSVALTVPGIFTVGGSPVTTSGTLAITASGTSGGIPYFSGATTLASSGALTQYGVVLGGGAGSTPTVVTPDATTTHILHGGSPPTFGAVAAGDLPAIGQTTAGVDSGARTRLGSNTNDSGAAGNIGELMTSGAQTVTTCASGANYIRVATISPTAGDWDISAACVLNGSGSTGTFLNACVTTTDAGTGCSSTNTACDSTTFTVDKMWSVYNSTAQVAGVTIPPIQIKLTGTTAYYVNARTDAVSQSGLNCNIRSRRMR